MTITKQEVSEYLEKHPDLKATRNMCQYGHNLMSYIESVGYEIGIIRLYKAISYVIVM